jgi:DNA-binding NarL/FixJ family response regulator
VSASPTKKKTICVLGSRLLQNRLIAHHLQKRIGIDSHAVRTLDEARSLLKRKYNLVDVFLMDCEGKDLAPARKGLRDVRSQMPARSLLALFNVGSRRLGQHKVLRGQVKGVFLEGDSIEEIAAGVSTILDGKPWVPAPEKIEARARSQSADPDPNDRTGFLTLRERKILTLLQTGKSNQEIADIFGLKVQTVKNNLYVLFKKINVSNRNQAVFWVNGGLEQ